MIQIDMTNQNELNGVMIGKNVTYKVCNSIYQGTIVKINNDKLIVIGCEDGMILFNAGCSLGDEISKSQIISYNESNKGA